MEVIVMKCENVPECPCQRTECENYGKCCACVKSHRDRGYLPYCLRPSKCENMDVTKDP